MERIHVTLEASQLSEFEALRPRRISRTECFRVAIDDYIAKLRREAAKQAQQKEPRR